MQAIDCEAKKRELLDETADAVDQVCGIGGRLVPVDMQDDWLNLMDKLKQVAAVNIECAYQLGLNDRGEG